MAKKRGGTRNGAGRTMQDPKRERNRETISQLVDLLQAFESSSLGKALAMLVEDAEKGRACPESAPDMLIGPQRVAELLGYSWRTCKDSILPRYDVTKVQGTGRGVRYRQSDIIAVQMRMVEDGTGRVTK